MPSKIPLSTHLPTSEGWTAELAMVLRLVVSTTGFEPTGVDPARMETLRLNDSAAPGRKTQLQIIELYRTQECTAQSQGKLRPYL